MRLGESVLNARLTPIETMVPLALIVPPVPTVPSGPDMRPHGLPSTRRIGKNSHSGPLKHGWIVALVASCQFSLHRNEPLHGVLAQEEHQSRRIRFDKRL